VLPQPAPEGKSVREIMAAGAAGYILKNVTKSDFVTALRTVAGGQSLPEAKAP
jgi:DNA-binding NarL/FixJ family response regulator